MNLLLQTPVYEGYEGFIGVMQSIFSPIWNGLNNICVPGTDWTISSFFLALLTAGVVGKIAKHLLGTFGSHFEDGLRGGRPRSDRSRTSRKDN